MSIVDSGRIFFYTNDYFETPMVDSGSAYDTRSKYYNPYALGNRGFSTGVAYGSGTSTQMTNPLWSQYMQQAGAYQPQTGTYQQPATMPYDQSSMAQYFYPAALAQQQATLQPQVSGATTAANMAERQKVATSSGWTAPPEASPSLLNTFKKNLATALQSSQSSAARSGMPISSATAATQENTTQAAFQAIANALFGARQQQQQSLMSFYK